VTVAGIRTAVDPVTFAVLRHGLIATAEKTFSTFRRAALLPLIYEGGDFAVSLFDDRLNLVADAASIPLFTASLVDALGDIVDGVGRDSLAPGDVLLTNLPSLNGSHAADGIIVEPVFLHGRLVAFMALRAHMGDVGGDSFAPTATTEVFQEGLLLPPLKLYRAGVLNGAIVEIIKANSRLPEATAGNALAAAGSLRIGSAALRTKIERYTLDTYYAVIDELLDHGERIARAGVERIPDGVYSATGAMDDDGVTLGVPVPLAVTVTVEGSELTVDTTGSAAQQQGPINTHFVYTKAAARLALKTLAASSIPPNSGEYRGLTVVAPPGSVFNPAPTAASYLSVRSTMQLIEMILFALAPALPDEVPAMAAADMGIALALLRKERAGGATSWGLNATPLGSGFGARRGADGPSALYIRQACDLRSFPLEVLESRHPALKVRCELDRDSGGPGRWRGGLGMVEEQQLLAPGIGAMGSERTSGAAPISGLEGGLPPRRQNGVRFYYGSDHELGPPSCKRSKLPIAPGDRYLGWTAGGGGFGDPLERDPAAVARDVLNDYVSPDAAYHDYGVVIGDDRTADLAATQARRAELRATREAGGGLRRSSTPASRSAGSRGDPADGGSRG
jgi:N-methylhydantoinase B